MALLTITTFAAFANCVVAGCKLTAATTPVDALKSLADIATGAKSLDAALGTTGLAAVAAEMARTAEDHARHFTHPGPARDDAIALFWQVAPSAFADPATFAAAHLDPALTADRMVAAIHAGPHARDFAATPLAEPFFRGVAVATLRVMLARADIVAALAPALWRQSLENDAALKGDTSEILALVRDLHAMRTTTVPEATLIAMARKISPRIADRDEALRALDAAADLAAEAQARGEAGSNVDAFVDATLRRLATLTAEGRLDTAAEAADAAVAEAEAGLTQLLDAAIRQHLLAFDAEAAARQIVRKLTLETPYRSDLFGALRREQTIWYERGHDYGLRLDLEVSIALARDRVRLARGPEEAGTALNELGLALATLGERVSGTDQLEKAVAAYRAALEEWTRERLPLYWAGAQINLGNVLRTLGERESGTEGLEQAVAAHRAALEVLTRERAPLDWALTQMNLGNTLLTLGGRESDTNRLDEAVAAYRAALDEWTRECAPIDWARTQMNLGNALRMLGERESGTDRLEQAVAAHRAALEVLTRERAVLAWAIAQMNLGNALQTLGERESGTNRLEQAVAAHRAALEVLTRENVPLDWARTQMNLGNALGRLGARESSTDRLEQAVAAYRAALEEWKRKRAPVDWARTHMNLGNTLRRLGERESGTDRLEQAVAAYRAALEERTRERVPLDWATTQMNLGVALLTLGARESGTDRLEQAVAAYRAALEERTRERVPLDWANTIGNEGTALRVLAERTSDLGMARRALAQLEEAEAVLRDGGHAPWADTFARQIPEARALIARLSA